jgi:hypothetical protein
VPADALLVTARVRGQKWAGSPARGDLDEALEGEKGRASVMQLMMDIPLGH